VNVQSPPLHIALYHPEIPQNTGNIGRLCLGIGARLHLIHPLGFSTDQKAVRRAGLDYWKHVDVCEHRSDQAFFDWAGDRVIHALSSHAVAPYTACPCASGDVLLFGPESAGLPSEILTRLPSYKIPMTGPTRSLNLSNAVAVVAYGLMQTVHPELFR
jgi:tRNA (cytidine/uridine-2'-O-)-methyltransferase